MLQVEIDGKTVSVPKGSTVMDAAHVAGTYIPHFCYHKKLSIAASCRMCLVEVEKAPKPQPACATPVADGMKVHTCSPVAKEAQQGVMAFLLMNHPLDCPICDQGGECQLQDLSMGYGGDTTTYTEPKRAVKPKDMGSLISTQEMSRCIHCTRCVRFTEEIAGFQEIGMVGRSEHAEIMPFLGQVVQTELSGNVIDLCPVGALTSKPFRYSARSWELSRRKSIAAHDALGSHLIVQVKDHQVKRVLPLVNEDINECWLSDRDRFAYEGLNSPDRLHHPMIKQDNQWHEVDWETALNYVVKGLNGVASEHGKDAIACFINPNTTFEEAYLTHKLFKQFGVGNIDSHLRRQDDSTLFEGAHWLGQSIQDLLSNQAVLVIGASLRSEQPLLTARIRGSVKNKGLQLSVLGAVAEELRMSVCTQAVVHPLAWTDYLSELLSIIHALKAKKNVAESKITQLARSLLEGDKTSIVLGALAQNHPDFAQIARLAAKIADETHSVFGFLPQAANTVGVEAIECAFAHKVQTRQLLAQAKKACLLVNTEPQNDFFHNALALNALKQADTVIAFTSFKDKTLLECADVLLPTAPFTETAGSFVNMEGRLQSFHAVVRALAETRPLWKILRVLGNLLDLSGFEWNTIEEVREEASIFVALEKRLSNKVGEVGEPVRVQGEYPLFRVGSVGLYETDAIVRRANALQQTPQAQIPQALLHPNTLIKLGLAVGECVIATQEKGIPVEVVVGYHDKLAENVVFLIHHTHTNTLGCLLGDITLSRG